MTDDAKNGVVNTVTSAVRVAAYREELDRTGYSRADIAIPKNVCKRIKDVATAESTSYAQALASLAQLGLAVYDARKQYTTSSMASGAGAALQPSTVSSAHLCVTRTAESQNSVRGDSALRSHGALAVSTVTCEVSPPMGAADEVAAYARNTVELPSALAQAALSPIATFFRNRKKD